MPTLVVTRFPGEKANWSEAEAKALLALDFVEKPAAGEVPIIFGGGNRNAKKLSHFLVCHAGEITQLDHFGLQRMLQRQFVQRLMNRQQLVSALGRRQFKTIEVHSLEGSPVTLGLLA